ncbi:MAG: hypothetical protein SV598_05090 [Pseudomonadota bacterium]|nr:hypothetical protein [Pseudomonadota bacterium]
MSDSIETGNASSLKGEKGLARTLKATHYSLSQPGEPVLTGRSDTV